MTERKKQYASPTVDVLETSEKDVITTSPIELPPVPASVSYEDSYRL